MGEIMKSLHCNNYMFYASLLLFNMFVFLYCVPANAQDELANLTDKKVYEQCIDKSKGETDKLIHCTQSEIERMDSILNVSYKKIMKSKISKKDKDAIRSAERVWLVYREKMMNVISKFKTVGSMETIDYNFAYMEMLYTQAKIICKISHDIENK